jgi:diguanylate cyclase (GGDEF)-like protein
MPSRSASHMRFPPGRCTVPILLTLLLLASAPARAAEPSDNPPQCLLTHGPSQATQVPLQPARPPGFSGLALAGLAAFALAAAAVPLCLLRRRTRELAQKDASLSQQTSGRARAEAELKQARSYFEEVLEGLGEPVVVLDFDCRVLVMNRAARAFSRCEDRELRCYQLFHGREHPCSGGNGCRVCGVAAFRDGASEESLINEHSQFLPDGGVGWYEMTASPLRGEAGARRCLLVSLHDITKRKRAEEAARLLADFDPLTRLPNRRLFNDRLNLALAQAHRRREKLALLFFDLDRFKVINDTLGHVVGDLLLQEVAKRLKDCSRREEDTIARQGGDEFIVILTEIPEVAAATKIARELVAAFRERFDLAGHELFLSCSIGVSIYPDDGEGAEELLRNADAALYWAKEHGRNCFKVYNPELNRRAMERLTLEQGIRRALENGEFVLHYQPKVNVKSSRIVCLEALIRWEHPELGLLMPGSFVEMAEETGSIIALGEWVLRSACSQNRCWQKAGHPPVRVAVNVSERQFLRPDLVESVASVLEETGLEAKWLDLELNFSLLAGSPTERMHTLEGLIRMGVHISVANLGKGYSSLSFLKGLPVHTLKVDRSCVAEIENNPEFAAAFVHLAHSVDLEVIHEGVETMEQLAFFRSIACEEMQGYLFSRPLPPDQVVALLDKSVITALLTGAPVARSSDAPAPDDAASPLSPFPGE